MFSKRIKLKLDETFIITAYLALKPLYVFESGNLQPSDIWLVFGVVFLLIRSHLKVSYDSSYRTIIKALFTFVVYATAVNMVWFLNLYINSGKIATSFIKSTLFFVFNFIAVVLLFIIIKNKGMRRTISAVVTGCVLSALISLAGMIIGKGIRIRNVGFFNNPNQLGYYSIVLISYVFFLKNYFKPSVKWAIVLISIYGAIVSLSKAAGISLVILAFLYIIINRKNLKKGHIVISVFALLIFTVLIIMFYKGTLPGLSTNLTLRRMRYRFLRLFYENDSNLESGRGYSRVLEMGMNCIFGMGEGAYNRFSSLRGLEVHSAYVNLFVSYGIIGTLIFGYFFSILIKKKGETFINISWLSGILLYNVTHNGIRNTMVWILLALVYAMQHEKSEYIEEKGQTVLVNGSQH